MQVAPIPPELLALDRDALETIGRHYLALAKAILAETERRHAAMARRRDHKERLKDRQCRVHGLMASLIAAGQPEHVAALHAAQAEGIDPEQASAFHARAAKQRARLDREKRNAAIVRAWRAGSGTMATIAASHDLSEAQVSRIVREGLRPT